MKWIRNAVFCVVRFFVKLFYPQTEVKGEENLPEAPYVLIGNHSQLHGPIISELFLPEKCYTWCSEEMMTLSEVPDFAYRDFWSGKPAGIRWFYRLLSYLIAPLAVCIFNSAHTVPVYRDERIMRTFRESVNRLSEGCSLVIFPEHEKPHNRILYEFQDGFVDVARRYYRKTGRALPFVPFYISPELHQVIIGKPTVFDPCRPIKEERARICNCLIEEITKMALSLPPHKVVPFLNLKKEEYIYSK